MSSLFQANKDRELRIVINRSDEAKAFLAYGGIASHWTKVIFKSD